MKAELVPEGGGPPIPITRDVTVVGRREFCDVQLNDPSLSKRHCVLVKTDGLLVVRDLASTNGTKVKGQKIRWAALLPDDKIAFGQLKFRVYLGPDDSPSPSERANTNGATNGGPKRKTADARAEVGTKLTTLPGFVEPSPLQGVPIVAHEDRTRPPASSAFPMATLVGDEDDLVLVEDEDEIIDLE